MATDEPSYRDRMGRIWYRDRAGRVVGGLYLVFTLVGVLVSLGVWDVVRLVSPSGPGIVVPDYVYLYGFMGAMAYVFTSLLTEFDKSTGELLQVGLRIPAALLLAAGLYLLSGFLVGDGSDRVLAGMSFLVGLYVKLALEALGGLAKRLYGKK